MYMNNKQICRFAAAVLAVLILFSAAPSRAAGEGDDFIKWVDFNVTYSALSQALEADLKYHDTDTPLDWVELLAYLGAKYGGDYSKYSSSDLSRLVEDCISSGGSGTVGEGLAGYDYYYQAYSAVLGEFVGDYRIQVPVGGDSEEIVWEEKYGLKVFSPIAAGFYYDDYKDFGSSRTYGYTRRHLGHDMFGQIGTPIIAMESGVVEVMGWNQYGGWRVGIRSFDGLRYYYYAHLRQNLPFHCDLKEGETVKAGDVIGYMGHTGYSTSENVNNIKQTHLHVGLQLIFDDSQKEGAGEIWVDVYPLTELLRRNMSDVYRVPETKEFYRKFNFDEPLLTLR